MGAQVRMRVGEKVLGELVTGRGIAQQLRARVTGIGLRFHQGRFRTCQALHRIADSGTLELKRRCELAHGLLGLDQQSEKYLKFSRLPALEAAARIDETRHARELERSPG